MEGTCDFCHRGSDVEDVCGKLHVEKVDGKSVGAHHKCMQYSAQLVQYKFDHFGGFKIDKVQEEIKRGRFMKCYLCKWKKRKRNKGRLCANGATAGCAVKNCNKTFHFYCAHQDSTTITKRMLIRYKEEKQQVVMYRVFCSPEHERYFRSNKSELLLPFNAGNLSSSSDDEEEQTSDDDTLSYSSTNMNNNSDVPLPKPKVLSNNDGNNVSILSQPSPVASNSKHAGNLKGKKVVPSLDQSSKSAASKYCPKSKKSRKSFFDDDDESSNVSSLGLDAIFDPLLTSDDRDNDVQGNCQRNGKIPPDTSTPNAVKVMAEINHVAMGSSPVTAPALGSRKKESRTQRKDESSEDEDEIKSAPIETSRLPRKCTKNILYNETNSVTPSYQSKNVNFREKHDTPSRASERHNKRKHGSDSHEDFLSEKDMERRKSTVSKRKIRVIDSDSDTDMEDQELARKKHKKSVHKSHKVVNIKPKETRDRGDSPVNVTDDVAQGTVNISDVDDDLQETSNVNLSDDNSQGTPQIIVIGNNSLETPKVKDVSVRLARLDSTESLENTKPHGNSLEKKSSSSTSKPSSSKARKSLLLDENPSELDDSPIRSRETHLKPFANRTLRKENSSLDLSREDSIDASTEGEKEPTNLQNCGLILTHNLECNDSLRTDLLKLASKELDVKEDNIAFWLDAFKLENIQKEIMPHLMNDIGQILCNEDNGNGKIAKLLTNADRLHGQIPNYDYVLTLYKSMNKSLVQTMQDNVFKTLKQNLKTASKKYGYTVGKLLKVKEMNALILTVDDKLDPKGLIRRKMLPASSDALFMCSADIQFDALKKSASKIQIEEEKTKILNLIRDEFQGMFRLEVKPCDSTLISDEMSCVTKIVNYLNKSGSKNKHCSNHILCVQPVDTNIINYSPYCKKLLGQYAFGVEENDSMIVVVSLNSTIQNVDDLISSIIVEERNLSFLTAHDPKESPVSCVVITNVKYLGDKKVAGRKVVAPAVESSTPRRQLPINITKEITRSSPRKHQSIQ